MSTSRPQQAPSEGEGRPRPPAPSSPLRLRVPQLSSEAPRPMQVLGELEGLLAEVDTASPETPTPAPIKAELVAKVAKDDTALVSKEPAEVAVPDAQQEAKATAVGRRLRFDPPADKVAPAARPETSGKPPYMATGSWKARLLVGSLWASGGALATAAIIVIGLFLARAGGNTPLNNGSSATTPVRWSQETETPLRTAQPVPESELSANHASQPEVSPRATGQLHAYEPQTVPVGIAREPVASEPARKPEIDPADLPLEAPVRPRVAERQTPDVLYCGPQPDITQGTPPQPQGGEAAIGRSREIQNPYCTPPQTPVDQTPSYSPYTPQAAAPGLPPLPTDVPSPHETYPRTHGSTWEFTPARLAERESLRTSMRPNAPSGSGENGVSWPVQGRGEIDGGEYRLQGTIDQIPLR